MASKTIVSSGASVIVSAWHYQVADAFQATLKAKDKAVAMVRKQYLERPTYQQYKLDLQALKAVADEKGRSYEWLRKCYAAAIVEIFESLPVSDDPEALRKKAERDAKKAKQKQVLIDTGLTKAPKDWTPVDVSDVAKTTRGAPKGQKQDHAPSKEETLEQYIARFDTFEVLEAVARMLAVEKSTELEAAGLASIAANLRKVLKRSEVAVAKQEPKRRTQNNKQAS